MDREGRIIGIVVSKLDEIALAKHTGNFPQNVNFAIKGNIAMNFLDEVGIQYEKSAAATPSDTPTIANMAQQFTFLVDCER